MLIYGSDDKRSLHMSTLSFNMLPLYKDKHFLAFTIARSILIGLTSILQQNDRLTSIGRLV